MNFKEVRKQAREIAMKRHWSYMFQDKSGEWYVSDCENFNSKNAFFVDKSGKIINMNTYEKVKNKLKKSGEFSIYPFSPAILNYVENMKK